MKYLLLIVACAFVFASPVLAQKTSMDYLREGSAAYIAGEYEKAIPPYQKALDLEKQERKLERKLWFGKGSLGLDFQIQNPQSKIRNRGVACGHGELGDEDNAIKWLRPAFKYKANMLFRSITVI